MRPNHIHRDVMIRFPTPVLTNRFKGSGFNLLNYNVVPPQISFIETYAFPKVKCIGAISSNHLFGRSDGFLFFFSLIWHLIASEKTTVVRLGEL